MITEFLQALTEREPIDPELQKYLTKSGYYGRTAKCLSWELVGVQRPGWIQVFEFQIRAKRTTGDWEEKFGICRTDERDGTYEIQLFDNEDECREARLSSTEDMITTGRQPNSLVKTFLMILFVAAITVATIGAVISQAKAQPPLTNSQPE